MRLEQIIRSTMTEAADMDGRLDQLVRAGLMPTSSLPLLKRAISRMHAGMSLQGAERDVMNMFINSMMFIVLGDDTVFNKARAGAKSYAAEEVELDEETDLEENAKIVAHLSKRYGDNIRKSHVMSAAKDFGVDASKLAKAVRKKLGKTMLDEEEQIDELSKATMGRYVNKAATKMGSQGVTAGLKIAADEKSSKNFKDMGKREKGIKLAVSKLTKEDIEQVDEISKATLGSYVKKASGAEQPKNVMSPKNVPLTKIAAYQGDSETGHFGSRFNQHTYDKAERLRKNRETGIKRAVDKLTKEEVEITEASVADVAKTAHLHVRAGKHDSIHTAIQSAVNTHFPSSVHSSVTRKKVAAQALSKIQSMNKSKMTKEDAEQIDELSKRTLGSYVKKAKKELSSSDYHVGRAVGARETGQKSNFSPELERKLTKRGKKRYHGIDKAVDKMMTKEDVEQVDEISKAMAGRYVKKAAASIDLTAWRQGYKEAGAGNPSKHLEKKLSKRHKGIETAVKKLTKEDIDAVKKMNESYKTAFQTALNEYGIKSPSELDESKRKEFFNHVDLEFKKGDN